MRIESNVVWQGGACSYKGTTQGILVVLELFNILTVVMDPETYTHDNVV